MATQTRHLWFMRLARVMRLKRVRNAATLGLVVLGPILALTTFAILSPLNEGAGTVPLRLILLADLIYVLVVATLVLGQVARLIAARRAKSAGSRLHLRLTSVFGLLALIPTVTVAIFASLTINFGLEGWFSERVQQVVGSSLEAAQSYEEDQRQILTFYSQDFAQALQFALRREPFTSHGELLIRGQTSTTQGFREAYLVDGTGDLRARGDGSYLFNFERPGADALREARETGVALIEDWANDEFRALVPLEGFLDRFVYLTRDVDGDLLLLLDDTRANVQDYLQLENDRGRLLFQFALLYLIFAVILILAAIWAGLWFAERLSGPVGRLTGAAQRVGSGDLNVRVVEEDGDDEIAMLGRYFNQMTKQLKGQRDTLLDNTRQIERRRRLFDSVLSSVTSGVVGLDPDGRITFVNRSAERLLDWRDDQQALDLQVAVPEFGPLFDELKQSKAQVAQREVKVVRQGRLENLLVRMANRRSEDDRLEGYVVAFDDVTDLVSAQRMAAWGDVARRIAHEIKNPLTPIQLSAERIKRKFAPQVTSDADKLEQMTDVIVRQTGDLRRIVDEFSKFARMPEPDRREHDLAMLVRDAVTLQRQGQPDVEIVAEIPETPVTMRLDATMIGQALTNLIKNAGEAIETLQAQGAPEGHLPTIKLHLEPQDQHVEITIEDNGIGLPEDRARLFEPYVTTRSAGTGLGLPIVKKIIEEHGGTLTLEDATAPPGALARIRLPRDI